MNKTLPSFSWAYGCPTRDYNSQSFFAAGCEYLAISWGQIPASLRANCPVFPVLFSLFLRKAALEIGGQVGRVGMLRPAVLLPSLGQITSGSLHEREINLYCILIILFGGLFLLSSLACTLINSFFLFKK